jgi:hypothetical protein
MSCYLDVLLPPLLEYDSAQQHLREAVADGVADEDELAVIVDQLVTAGWPRAEAEHLTSEPHYGKWR